MPQTVIGFFDNASDARRAEEQLHSRGIGREHIDVSTGHAGTAGPGHVSGDHNDPNTVRTTAEGRTVDREGRNTNRITDFFNSLFGGGHDKDDADRYSRVAERSGAIVTVHVQSREEAERAADILDDCGAVDVDERSTQYGYTSTRNTEGMGDRSNVTGGGMRMRSRIVDRSVDEQYRLREGYGTGQMGDDSSRRTDID
jgi:hypothetical protein